MLRKWVKFSLLLIGLLLGQLSFAYTEEDLRQLAWSEEWLNHLHYEKNIFGHWRSLLDGDDFFFSKEGKTDPYAELVASLAAVDSKELIGKIKQIPRCAFPERYFFLDKKLKLNLKPVRCEKLEEFLAQFKLPQGLSLVFSSAYPNNPASMFGHTFLKVRSQSKSDLVDQGLNYAALVADDENPFAFMWFGVTGGYIGRWSNVPYYVKINEYVNAESRDIWEYELNFTPEETLRVIYHLWEIETNSHFDYYFFDENCSYQILKVIVTVKPEWKDILKHHIYVIPGETIKKIAEVPGAVLSVNFRPSRYKKLLQHYDALDKKEKERFFDLIKHDEKVKSETSRPVIDALAVYYEYSISEKKKLYKQSYEQKREELLSHRSTLGRSTAEEKARLKPIISESRPDWGHDPYYAGLGYGHYSINSGEENKYYYLHLKSAYHDLLNDDRGYSPFAHIEFPQIKVAYDEQAKEFQIKSLLGLATTSLFPINRLEQKMSWKLKLGMERVRNLNCADCLPVFAEGGGGYSINIFNQSGILYSMLSARAELHRDYDKGQRYAPGFELGLAFHPASKMKFHLFVEKNYYIDPNPVRESHLSFQAALHPSKNFEYRMSSDWFLSRSSDRDLRQYELSAQIGYFFR